MTSTYLHCVKKNIQAQTVPLHVQPIHVDWTVNHYVTVVKKTVIMSSAVENSRKVHVCFCTILDSFLNLILYFVIVYLYNFSSCTNLVMCFYISSMLRSNHKSLSIFGYISIQQQTLKSKSYMFNCEDVFGISKNFLDETMKKYSTKLC